MKKLLLVGLMCSCSAWAQTIESRIYVCTDATGAVRLNNLKSGTGCVEKLVQTPVVTRQNLTAMMSDPQPAPNALIVPVGLQMRRDTGRSAILRAELGQAAQSLLALQNEYQNGTPERLGSEQNYQKYLDRVQDLKNKIELTQANINAIQREIGREQ